MDFCPDCCRVYQEHHEFCSSDATPLVPMTADHDPLVGRVFDDRYELIRLIGAGGNGVVYLAKQVGLDRVVAFKMMFAERIKEERALRRFAREARALAALNHPGCVRVLDYRAAEDSVPYLVMELVEGFELTGLLQQGGVPAQHAVLIAAQIAEAVDAAHQTGMVHRDLKPENVILEVKDGDFGLTLIDFGLALVLDDAEKRLTRQGRIVGTPEYMSPEQIMGRDTDGRTDIYSLGVMLYELLTGVPPFRGITQSMTLEMHLDQDPPPLTLAELDSPVAEKLRRVVFGMLEKKPEDRPRDAQEVARVLRALERELPDAGRASGLLEMPQQRDERDTDTLDGSDTAVHELPPELRDPFEREATRSGDGRRSQPPTRRAWFALGGGALASIGLGVLLVVAFYEPAALPTPRALVPGPPAHEDIEPAVHTTNEGRMVVEDVSDDAPIETTELPTAGTIELPGGDLQTQYETALRSLGSRLAAQGLRPRDVRSHPRGMRAWTAQSREASGRNYAGARAQVGEFSSVAGSKSPREWMVYRLQRVESGLGNSPPAAISARAHALWNTLDHSSASPANVRRWLRRVDAIDPRSR